MSTRRVEVSRHVNWVLEVRGEALFHQFGTDYEEFEAGPGNFTAAVIEWPTGVIELVRADRIRFLEPTI